jgi:hypothetical protein
MKQALKATQLEKLMALASMLVVLTSATVAVAQSPVQMATTEQVVQPVVKDQDPVKPLSEFVNKTSLTDLELVELLRAVGFEGKSLRIAWAIAKKESNGRPLAYNGNAKTGDSSYGIYQINMLGELGPDRRIKFSLDSNSDLFNPVINAQIAYHMSDGGEDFSAWKISKSDYNSATAEPKFQMWLSKFPGEKSK